MSDGGRRWGRWAIAWLMPLVVLGSLVPACDGSDSSAQADCAEVRNLASQLTRRSIDAWSQLADTLPDVADDIDVVIDGLAAVADADAGVDQPFDVAEEVLAAHDGPLDRVRNLVRTECGVEIADPFAAG